MARRDDIGGPCLRRFHRLIAAWYWLRHPQAFRDHWDVQVALYGCWALLGIRGKPNMVRYRVVLAAQMKRRAGR